MSLLLNIDTALDTASVCLANGEEPIELLTNDNQKDHATWLHKAITSIFEKTNYTINDLAAVAVSIGPGSYTGLRVGLAAAKGLCYALNIPLITINTLKIIALAVKDEIDNADFICPMIDARRMEVFTALYDKNLWEKNSPHAIILDENFFSDILQTKKIIFCGNGSKKLQGIINSPNALFNNSVHTASHLNKLALHSFLQKEFADLAYTEPLYIKEFYSSTTRLS